MTGKKKRHVAVGKDHTRVDSHRMWGDFLGQEEGTGAVGRRPRNMEAGAERGWSTFCLHPTRRKLFLLFSQVIIPISGNYYR